MRYDPTAHHRRSTRLKGYDYSQAGAYFVTLVTDRREPSFGEVINGEMKLSPLGQIVQREWMRSMGIRKEILLYDDEFVVMPNHVHGIVWMVGVTVGADGSHPGGEEGAYHAPQQATGARETRLDNTASIIVGADGIRPGGEEGAYHAPQPETPRPTPSGQMDKIFHRTPKSLGAFIAGFKASVTGRARREFNMMGIWQRNYYEHIIRNDAELERIRKYIEENPLVWIEDQLHPDASPNLFNAPGC